MTFVKKKKKKKNVHGICTKVSLKQITSGQVEVDIIMTGLGYGLEPPYVRISELYSTHHVRNTGALS